MVFADPLVRLFAGDYADVPGKIELTVILTRIMCPSSCSWRSPRRSWACSTRCSHFFVPALSPAMFNVVSIVCAVGLDRGDAAVGLPAIAAVAIGTIVGGLAQMAGAVATAAARGVSLHAGARLARWAAPGAAADGPGTIGLAATQVNCRQHVARHRRGTGAVSWLDAAFRLMYLPIGLFGVSIATATTPAISRMPRRATARQ